MDDGDQSISRKRKMDNRSQSVDDLLSDLPLSIIHHILALVPIGDAVRTCVLSSKWRFIWASLPHLVFDYGCRENFVTSALLLHKGPIHTFRCFDPRIPHRAIDLWLLYLSRSEIREFFLQTGPSDGKLLRLHSNLYSCRMLTHLELFYCELGPPPLTFNGFSFLRSLVLRNVEVPCNVLESLVAKSPLLENLTCDTLQCVMNSALRISAPKLKYFHLASSFKELSLCAPFVAEVSVRRVVIQSPAEQLQQKSPVCTYAKFFGGFTHLEKLTAEGCFTEYLSIGIESYDHSLVFHRLKSIRLCEVGFEDKKQLAVVGHLIMSAPNLHELEISSTGYEYDESDESDASGSTPNSFSDFGCLPNFIFKKLRVVRMTHVCGLPCEMGLIKYLLKRSPLLQTMILHRRFEPLPELRSNLATNMLMYRRASPKAKIYLR